MTDSQSSFSCNLRSSSVFSRGLKTHRNGLGTLKTRFSKDNPNHNNRHLRDEPRCKIKRRELRKPLLVRLRPDLKSGDRPRDDEVQVCIREMHPRAQSRG